MVFQPLSLTVTLGVMHIMYRYVSRSLFCFYRADGGLGLQLTSNGFEFTANFNVRDSPHPATDTGAKAADGGGGGGGVIIPVYFRQITAAACRRLHAQNVNSVLR